MLSAPGTQLFLSLAGPTVGACACLRGYAWHPSTPAHPRSVGPRPEAFGSTKGTSNAVLPCFEGEGAESIPVIGLTQFLKVSKGFWAGNPKLWPESGPYAYRVPSVKTG